MKNFSIFTVVLLVLSFASCSIEDIGNCSPGRPEQACDAITQKLYTGSGKIYMALWGDNTSESLLEVGSMINGKITLALPENVDSHFLESSARHVKPSDVEVGSYTRPLRLFNNSGKLIGGLKYEGLKYLTETDEGKFYRHHKIFHWYFSKDAKMEYSYYNLETKTFECNYNIDAKQGWNEIHFYQDLLMNDGLVLGQKVPCYTADLSKVPNDLMWLVVPTSQL